MTSRRLPLLALAAAALALLAGCATHIFPEYNPAGRNIAGQMLYSGKHRTFIGDFTVRQSPTDFALDVNKGPVQLILVRENDDNLVRVEALNHAWQGNPQHFVPAQVRNWVALREVFNGGSPAGATVTRTPSQITAVFANGERFVFRING
ncbi:MAG TPA: hypothetical protein VHY22_15550 [Chthoniobacteraceae bacterium]|jgi:hypothetical protein|nr:hypothetical protein [Chthoniobacteraceae bacterium]